MNLDILPPTAPDEWALNICLKTPGTTEYWNPIGGVDLFNKEKYIKNNIGLYFLEHHLPQYRQRRSSFEPGLSIIDVMMFNDVECIQNMLDDFTLHSV